MEQNAGLKGATKKIRREKGRADHRLEGSKKKAEERKQKVEGEGEGILERSRRERKQKAEC